MSPTVKLILVLIGLAYLISPADLIPDLLLPWVGWIDDGLVLWTVYYIIRYGELPWFLFKKRGRKINPEKRFTSNEQGSDRAKTGASTKGTGQQPRKPGQEDRTSQKKPGGKPEPEKDPYEVLGIDPDADWEQIQGVYKTKIKQYHPDKLSHLGEEFSDLANEKFLDIQAAYDRLKREKGK